MQSEESSKTRTEIYLGDVPGGPVPSSAGGEDSVPGWRAKIPHASWPKNQNMKNRSNIVTNSIKTLKWSTFLKKKLSLKNNRNEIYLGSRALNALLLDCVAFPPFS